MIEIVPYKESINRNINMMPFVDILKQAYTYAKAYKTKMIDIIAGETSSLHLLSKNSITFEERLLIEEKTNNSFNDVNCIIGTIHDGSMRIIDLKDNEIEGPSVYSFLYKINEKEKSFSSTIFLNNKYKNPDNETLLYLLYDVVDSYMNYILYKNGFPISYNSLHPAGYIPYYIDTVSDIEFFVYYTIYWFAALEIEDSWDEICNSGIIEYDEDMMKKMYNIGINISLGDSISDYNTPIYLIMKKLMKLGR